MKNIRSSFRCKEYLQDALVCMYSLVIFLTNRKNLTLHQDKHAASCIFILDKDTDSNLEPTIYLTIYVYEQD